MYTETILPGGKIIRLETTHFWTTVAASWWGNQSESDKAQYANGLNAKTARPIGNNTVSYGGRYWQWGMWA